MNAMLAFFQSQIGKPVENSVSPMGNWLNGTLVAASENEMVLSFTVRNDMTNPAGTLHGGAASAIIDEAMGMAVFALNKEFIYVTVSLAIDFLDNAREGETIVAKAQIVRNGRTLVNIGCEVTNEAGKLLAKGSSNMVVTQMKNPMFTD
ncbi:MAG: PaaI family thioesterase [Verrucomicrobia bacterium]|nr:PaaI family thioesterase [Cytophagales bacterium]